MRKALWVFDFSNKKYKSWCNWWITLNSIIGECGSQCSHSGVWLCYTHPPSRSLSGVWLCTLALSPCSRLGVWLWHTHPPSMFFISSWCRHEAIIVFSLTVKIMLANRNGRNNYLEIFLWCNLPVSLAHGVKMKGLSLSWRSRNLTVLGRVTSSGLRGYDKCLWFIWVRKRLTIKKWSKRQKKVNFLSEK